MMQPTSLFEIYNTKDEFLNDAHHLAAMTALFGPPSREFLDRSQESLKYWDENGRHPPLTELLAADRYYVSTYR